MKSNTPKPSAHDRILTTAHRLFYQYGIRATGVDRIIAESNVTKVTFYRHFPSKNDLIRAFLHYRHKLWLDWFTHTLQRHGEDIHALAPTLTAWFESEEFRGCAFINTVGELAHDLPEVVTIARSHKHEMMEIIADLLPPSAQRDELSSLLAIAVDGAIVRAQYEETPDCAVQAITQIVNVLSP